MSDTPKACQRCYVEIEPTAKYCGECEGFYNRQIARLYETGDYNLREIGELVGLTPNVVQKRLASLQKKSASHFALAS